MKRYASYLGITLALLLGILLLAFSGNTTVVNRSATSNAPVASSTPSSSPVPLSPEASGTTTTAQATSSVSNKKTASSATSVASVQPTATSASVSVPLTAAENAALDASASALRAALVNIICYAPAGSGLHSISGSGVFVDPKGVILTNAHIAQYFLLADRGVSCDIRAGSPAVDKYDAALAYIPLAWLDANAGVLAAAAPSGTGERDFALLAVTKSATSASLPSFFPYIPLATSAPSRYGVPVVIASYGAQFLAANQVQSALFPTIVFGSVKNVFTFASSTIDILALGGSVAAQEGSSGGGVADASSALTGVITTSTTEGATDTRSLSAITASYIRSEYAKETGQTLDTFLALPPATAIADFAPRISALEALITAHLP